MCSTSLLFRLRNNMRLDFSACHKFVAPNNESNTGFAYHGGERREAMRQTLTICTVCFENIAEDTKSAKKKSADSWRPKSHDMLMPSWEKQRWLQQL